MDLINKVITEILNPLIRVMFLAGLAVFIWGIVEFIWNANNQEKKEAGKRHIIWGLIGLTIMVCVFGIMQIIANFVKF